MSWIDFQLIYLYKINKKEYILNMSNFISSFLICYLYALTVIAIFIVAMIIVYKLSSRIKNKVITGILICITEMFLFAGACGLCFILWDKIPIW